MAIASLNYSSTPATSGGLGLVKANGQPMPASSSFLQQQAEAERRHTLTKAWKHYTGDLTRPFRPEPGQPDVNVLTNRSSTIVDTGVDFLYGKTITLEVLKDGKPQKDAQEALDGCWGNDAKRMTLLSKFAQNGGIFGHVFAKVIEPNEAKGRPYCRVVPLDPSQVTVVTDPDDCDTVCAYIIDWQEPAPPQMQQISLGRRQVIARLDPDDDADEYDGGLDPDSTWEITNWVQSANNTWVQIGNTIEWAHPWAPIIDWQNLPLANAHWGMSDIPPNVQHLNDVLNLALSNINAIAKHHSFPWLYASGVGLGATIELAPGKITQLQAPEGKLAAVEAHGDLPGLLSFADNLRADMDEQTRVPSVATGRLRDVPRVTSGVAFQMMYGPLLGKTVHKQRLYETGHEEVSLRALSLCGYGDGTGTDGWEVKTKWPSPLPNDDASTAQLVLAMKQIGVSEHEQYKVLNIDWDEDQEKKKAEAKVALDAYTKGQGMPPATMGMMPPTAPQDGQQGASTTQPAPQQQQPPQNHPAAVAQRNATKAVASAMKAGVK